MDALGNPVRLYLTPGNINDCTVATEVLSGVTLSGSVVMRDKAYGTVTPKMTSLSYGVGKYPSIILSPLK